MDRNEEPTRTVQEAFDLADRIESQIQVVDSFKLELSNNFFPAEINEVSAEETSGGEYEVNEVSGDKRWGYNNSKKSNYSNNQNFGSRPHQNTRTQENKSGKRWEQREKDAKITLTQEPSHFVPTKFSDSFFRQFDLAMKLKRGEPKNKGKVETEVSKITEGELVEAFGITKDQMVRAAEILAKDKNTKKLGNSSAWLAKVYESENYQSADTSNKEVMFIQQSNTKGMTFK